MHTVGGIVTDAQALMAVVQGPGLPSNIADPEQFISDDFIGL